MPRNTTVAAFTAGSTLRTSCFLPLPSKACLGLGLGLGLGSGSGSVLATAVEGLRRVRVRLGLGLGLGTTRYTTGTLHSSETVSIYLSCL